MKQQINDSAIQDCIISIANRLEIPQPCDKTSIWEVGTKYMYQPKQKKILFHWSKPWSNQQNKITSLKKNANIVCTFTNSIITVTYIHGCSHTISIIQKQVTCSLQMQISKQQFPTIYSGKLYIENYVMIFHSWDQGHEFIFQKFDLYRITVHDSSSYKQCLIHSSFIVPIRITKVITWKYFSHY